MRRSSSIAAFVLMVVATVPGAAAAGQQLAYALPAPATATYTMVDSTDLSLDGPTGALEIGGQSTWNFSLTFSAEGEGIRVAGELGEFEASYSNPMTGSSPASRAEAGVADSFEVLLGPRGLAEIVSETRRLDSDFPILVNPEAVIFPRLPAAGARAGDNWVDTVSARVGDGGDRVIVYTYTLEGEVDHDGRAHLRIAVSGESSLTIAEGPMSMNLTGSEAGHYLWDMERGLVASSEISRVEEGGMTAPDGTQVEVSFTATTRLTLEG